MLAFELDPGSSRWPHMTIERNRTIDARLIWSAQRTTRSAARPVPLATSTEVASFAARGAGAPGHERAASGATRSWAAGALIAIPIAAIIQLALNHFVFQQATVEMEVSEGRDYASRLRYEAQDLVQDLRKQARRKKGGSDLKIKQLEQVMDEIETLTTNLDALLAETNKSDIE